MIRHGIFTHLQNFSSSAWFRDILFTKARAFIKILGTCAIVVLSMRFFSPVVFSEPIQLSAEEAIERALEANFDIKKQDYSLKKLKINKFSNWKVLIPTVTAGATLNRLNTEPEASPLNPDPTAWSLSRNITVTTPVGSRLAQNLVEVFVPYRNYQAGEISYQEMLTNTAINVQKTYINMYIVQQQMSLLTEKLQTQIAKEDAMQKDYRAGLRDEFTYLQTQFEVIKSKQAFDQQQNAYQNLSEQLALLVGYSIDSEFILVDEINKVSADTVKLWLHSEGVEDNFSIQNLIIQDKILRMNLLKGYFGYFPQINLAWASRYNFSSDPTTTALTEDWGDDVGALSITFALPLSEYHPWSNTTVAIRSLQQDKKINELQQEQTLQRAKQQIAVKKRALQQAVYSLTIQEQQLEITKRAYDLAKESYGSGLMSITSYQDAEDNVYDAQINYLSFQSEIIQNILDISVLMGKRNLPDFDK